MPQAEEIFSIEGTVKHHSMKAVLVEIHGEDIWLPRSQLIDDVDLPKSGPARISMTAWIAKEKGLR